MLTPKSPHRHSCFIPFHLADPAGILFFGHVFTLAHQALESFVVDRLQCPWPLWFQNPDWMVPIKAAEAQYFHPLKAGQECQIELVVTAISTTSFTLASSIQQQRLCCMVKTVHVFCSKASHRKIEIPSSLLTQLQSHYSDHSQSV